MKYLKIFEDFNDLVEIKSDITDILAPITDNGLVTLEIVDCEKTGKFRNKSIELLITLSIKDVSDDINKVKPVDNKEDFERLKNYLEGNGYRFEKWWISDGWIKNWNDLFKLESDGYWDDEFHGFEAGMDTQTWYPIAESWIELYFEKPIVSKRKSKRR